MKNNITAASIFHRPLLLFVTALLCITSTNSNAQGSFTAAWPLTADQSYNISGAGAATVTGANQVMSSLLFIPASNSYIGTTSGTAGDGQRCSPKLNDGNDGGWLNDGAAVNGRYMEFVVSPNTGYDININNISFTVGNRSRSEIRGDVYYYIGATNAGFNIGTGTLLSSSVKAGSTNSWNSYSFTTNFNITSGNKIFLRIYPYNTGSNTTGKYFCTRNVSISGTSTTPNITNIIFTPPATCNPNQLTVTWNGPAGFNNGTQTILAFLKAGNFGTITPNTVNISTGYLTANSNFGGAASTYQHDGTAKLVYRGTGTDAAGNHSGLVLTGLTGGVNYQLLVFVVTGNTTYSAGVTGNGTSLNTVATPPSVMGNLSRTVQTTTTLPITWTVPAFTTTPDGYLVQVSNTATPANAVDFTDPGVQTDVSGGTGSAKVTPSTATGYNGFTGLTPGTMYYFRVNPYISGGGCIRYNTTAKIIQAATLPNPVTDPSFSIDPGGTGTISWTAAAGYDNANHTTLVFVKASAAVTTPSNSQQYNQVRNPLTYYTSSSTFGAGTGYTFDAASARCVYNGDGTSCTVTGLTQGTTYHVLILTMMVIPNTLISGTLWTQNVIGTTATYSTSEYVTTSTVFGGTYTWNAGNTTGNWATPGNWTPARNTPTTSDQLIFNTGENITPTGFTTQTIGTLTVTGSSTLNMTQVGTTLTINSNNGAASDLTINSGSTLNLSGGHALTLNANTTADISGILNVNAFGTYNISNAGAINTVTGTLKIAGTLNTIANNIVVNNNGTFDHAIDGGTIPTCVWNTGSTCRVSGITSATNISGHSQIFSRFVYDCASQGSQNFVLGVNTTILEALESFTVNRTGTGSLQLTSSSGQRDYTFGNYYQFGGSVSITKSTGSGGQRSVTVNNDFYVSDSLGTAVFYLMDNPSNDAAYGRLFVAGDLVMRKIASGNVAIENNGSNNFAEIWFNGNTNQYAQFRTITGNIDFNIAQTVNGIGVTLGSDAIAYKCYLTQGTFNIASNTLTINNAVSYPSPATGTIGGSPSSNLTLGFAGNTGTLNFAAGKRILKDFTQLAGNTTTLGTELSITAGLTPGRDSIGAGATLITNDNLILRSDANGTARMAQLPATAVISGKVTVERYLPMNTSYDSRRWRLLTAPFKPANAPTINAAWQQGVSNTDRFAPIDPKPGYGTQITKSSTWAADGYDQGSTNNPSIYYYSGGSWVAPNNTNAVKVTDNSGVYQLFARGDRSIIITNQFVSATPTTLEPKGELYVGNVTIPLAASGFQTVGNPYASAIKLDNIQFNDTLGKSKTVYLWDPKALGSSNVGKFITCSGDGGSPASYTYTGNASNYNSNPGVIESSGAFMVHGNGGNIVFHESDKISTSTTIGVASRPVRNPGSLGTIRKLHIDMAVSRNGEFSLADGVAVTYNRNYSNGLDAMDASKLSTFYTREELSIQRDNKFYAIERRNDIGEEDTIFLNISRLNTNTYRFTFRPVDFDENYSASLEDKYTAVSTPIDLINGTTADFTTTADSASFAAGRFYIVFKKQNTITPVPVKSPLSVFPNPVRDGLINIQTNSLAVGKYNFRLINHLGQVVKTGVIDHQYENAAGQIELPPSFAKGIYQLQITGNNKTVSTISVSVQ